jgi:hypothetical protein
MKLVMTLLVRDEADILAANLDYHLQRGVDFVIATDNRSEDATRDILEGYRHQGVLHYLYEGDDDYAQHRWVTRMARLAASEFGADWVINNDADEFWWPEQGDLKQVLAAMPAEIKAIGAPRSNFLPRPLLPGEFFAEHMTVREATSRNAVGAPLPPKVCHRAYPDIEVEQGNHAVSRHGRSLPVAPAPMTIFHFPLRGYAQFANKIAKGGAAYARNTYLPPEVGITWRRLYETWQKGELEAYYRAQVPGEAEIEQGIREGRLLREERLKDFFASLG